MGKDKKDSALDTLITKLLKGDFIFIFDERFLPEQAAAELAEIYKGMNKERKNNDTLEKEITRFNSVAKEHYKFLSFLNEHPDYLVKTAIEEYVEQLEQSAVV
jgi:hypothetical protein